MLEAMSQTFQQSESHYKIWFKAKKKKKKKNMNKGKNW